MVPVSVDRGGTVEFKEEEGCYFKLLARSCPDGRAHRGTSSSQPNIYPPHVSSNINYLYPMGSNICCTMRCPVVNSRERP